LYNLRKMVQIKRERLKQFAVLGQGIFNIAPALESFHWQNQHLDWL
jgi:hypothetical protein